MRPPLIVALVALCVFKTVAYQQVRDGGTTTPLGTAVISGLLLSTDPSPSPVRRALVTLSGSTLAFDLLTSTDESGQFTFVALPAGRFIVSASKTGYVRDSYGSHEPGGAGSPISLTANERIDLKMVMTRAAVIAGSVRLPRNAPTSLVRLQLLKYGLVSGQRRLVSARGGAYGVGEDGTFRLSGLVAGEYVVVASIWNTGSEDIRLMDEQAAAKGALQRIGFAPTFYPGEADPSRAIPVVVQAGEEKRGIDFTIRLVPAFRLEGQFVDADGKAPALVQATLTDALPVPRPAIAVRPGPDGRFAVTGLTPGRYLLSVRAAAVGAAQAPAGRGGAQPLPLWANRELELNGNDLTDVVVPLKPGRAVSGRITFGPGTTALPPSLAFLQVGLVESQSQAVRPSGWWTFANDDGTFSIVGVPPGRYRFVVQSTPDNRSLGAWVLKAATLDKRDLLDDLAVVEADSDLTNIAVTFTDRPAEIAGLLLDSSGKPAPEYFIVAFSSDPRYWIDASRRTTSIRPGRDGSFKWTGVAPGDYYLGAVTRLETGQLGDVAFIESLIPTCVKVSVKEGEMTRQDLKIGG
jgi:hypothetical protein